MECLEKSFLYFFFCFGGGPGALNQISTDMFKGQVISEVPEDKKWFERGLERFLEGSDRSITYVWEVNAMPADSHQHHHNTKLLL